MNIPHGDKSRGNSVVIGASGGLRPTSACDNDGCTEWVRSAGADTSGAMVGPVAGAEDVGATGVAGLCGSAEQGDARTVARPINVKIPNGTRPPNGTGNRRMDFYLG